MQTLTPEDVLNQFDDDARENAAFFPDLDHGYVYHVDQRLSVYAKAMRWVVVIEQFGLNPRSSGLAGAHTAVHYHGNAIVLPPQPGWGEHPVKTVTVVDHGPTGPLTDTEWDSRINPAAQDITIRGQVVPIRTDSNFYWARNIDIKFKITHEQIDQSIKWEQERKMPELSARIKMYEDMRPRVGKDDLHTWHLFRALVPEYRDLLLATEAERREGVPPDLPLLLQLDEWDHPKLIEGELPRGSDAFKMIARVVANNDAAHYVAEKVEPNTHWSNWPESGSL